MLGTFWSDWFIYFREGRAAAAAAAGGGERGGGREGRREKEEEKGWETLKSAHGLLRDLRSAPRSWPCHTSSSQAGQGPRPGRKRKEKTQKDSQYTLPRVKVASQFLKRLGKFKRKSKTKHTHAPEQFLKPFLKLITTLYCLQWGKKNNKSPKHTMGLRGGEGLDTTSVT